MVEMQLEAIYEGDGRENGCGNFVHYSKPKFSLHSLPLCLSCLSYIQHVYRTTHVVVCCCGCCVLFASPIEICVLFKRSNCRTPIAKQQKKMEHKSILGSNTDHGKKKHFGIHMKERSINVFKRPTWPMRE